jgi:hypothetical protein
LNLRCHVIQLDDEEVPLWRPGARRHSTPFMKGNSKVAAVRCDKSRGSVAERTLGGGGYPHMVRLQCHGSSRSKNAGPALKGGASNVDWRPPVADGH